MGRAIDTPESGGGAPGEPTISVAGEAWSHIKSVFLEAIELPEPERHAFLERACSGNAALRREVESLLASDAAAESFCETPAAVLLNAPMPARPPARLPAGTRLASYEITDFIGAGGMGVVYRARHTVLGRTVAIKTLGTHLIDDAARQRLIREARNASMLSHPNICTIHEVGETEETGPFIVMEYVRGQTLYELVRDTPPALDDVLHYGKQIAGALAHAHERGIVHRDLKSANVMRAEDGRLVVLDFGLAKRLPDSELSRDPTLTVQDALAGTLSHMAPEVLLGGTANPRSDVWALGVLLYELATGELPFQGRTPYETSSAIISDAPRALPARVPLALRLVIARCLLKNPDARYQSSAAVHAALDAIARKRAWPLIGPLLISVRRRTIATLTAIAVLGPAVIFGASWLRQELVAPARISSIALLPLENGTGRADAQYYADGLTDALIAQLGELSNARIVPRASIARAVRASGSRLQIAQQLRSDVIVEGSLRRADDRVAVDLKLVDPKGDRVLWSDSYERASADVLALQADAVRGLALGLRLAVRPEARERLNVVRAVNPEAYQAYLKGRYEWNQRTPASLEAATIHFNRAVALDPTYAPAHAALADCYNQLGTVMVGGGSPREFRPRAAAEAIKALQLDPNSAEAHATLGYVRHYELKWAEAEREFKRAIDLNPSYSLVRVWYANLLMSQLRLDEALQQVFAARELDPFSLVVNTNVGWVLDIAGRHAEAVTQLEHTLTLDSTYVQARQRLSGALSRAGRMPQAVAEAERIVAMTNRAPFSVYMLEDLRARSGQHDAARALLRELLERSRHEFVSPWLMALAFLSVGEVDQATPWIEKAFADGSNGVSYLAVEPTVAKYRHDPRIRAFVARAGLPL